MFYKQIENQYQYFTHIHPFSICITTMSDTSHPAAGAPATTAAAAVIVESSSPSSVHILPPGIPVCAIDEGRFKYVLMRVADTSATPPAVQLVVRGAKWAEYHDDIFQSEKSSIVDAASRKAGLVVSCVGGGRILHDVVKKQIEVYGYSVGYGKADHAAAVGLLREAYPSYAPEDIKVGGDQYE